MIYLLGDPEARAKDTALEVEDGLVAVRPKPADVGNHDGNGRHLRPLLGLDLLGGKGEKRLAQQASNAGRIAERVRTCTAFVRPACMTTSASVA